MNCLKIGLLWKERICSIWKQILSFHSRLLFRREAKKLTELPPPKVHPFLLLSPLQFWNPMFFSVSDFRHNITVKKEQTSPYNKPGFEMSPESPPPQSPNHPPRLRAIACEYNNYYMCSLVWLWYNFAVLLELMSVYCWWKLYLPHRVYCFMLHSCFSSIPFRQL